MTYVCNPLLVSSQEKKKLDWMTQPELHRLDIAHDSQHTMSLKFTVRFFSENFTEIQSDFWLTANEIPVNYTEIFRTNFSEFH